MSEPFMWRLGLIYAWYNAFEMQSSEIDRQLVLVTFTPSVVGYLREGGRVCLGVRKKVSLGLGENLVAGIGGRVGDTPEVKSETPLQVFRF